MGTRYRGTEREVEALDAYIRLIRAAESITSRLERRLQQHGLTLSQFGALEVLFHLGPMCHRALGEKLLKSSGNITTVVGNLERSGLVRRERNGDDRRFVTIDLTAAGRDTIERLFPEHLSMIVGLLSGVAPDELRRLGELSKKVGLHAASLDGRALLELSRQLRSSAGN